MDNVIQKSLPKQSLSAIKSKPDLTIGMLFCVLSAKMAYNYPYITQRLSLDMGS